MASNYTVAGMETLASILDNFISEKKPGYLNHFTREDISNFFGDVCNRFLHSYGQNFKGKKDYSNYNKKEAELFQKVRNTKFFDKSHLIADSGAYQTSIGILSKRESEILFKNYYNFLPDYKDVFDEAFILDLPPGPGCQMFSNFKQVYNMNLESYKIAANLPDDVRKKIIYIHHFRTPMLWDIYSKILRDNDFYQYFEKFATGGIVANSAGDTSIPCIIYVLPLIPLLNETIKHKRTKLDFHVLGGATYRDLFFYEIFKLHVKKLYNIDLNITYDSSGLFKGLMIGRYFCTFDGDIVRKVPIKTDNLNKRFKNHLRINDITFMVMEKLSNKYGFKKINHNEIYDPSTKTFYEDIKIYLMLYMLEFYKEVEDEMERKCVEIYNQYESGDNETFTNSCEQITRNLNYGKISKKQISKTNSVSKSLDMLKSLDENYCKYIVKKFLSKDEFINLMNDGQILTI